MPMTRRGFASGRTLIGQRAAYPPPSGFDLCRRLCLGLVFLAVPGVSGGVRCADRSRRAVGEAAAGQHGKLTIVGAGTGDLLSERVSLAPLPRPRDTGWAMSQEDPESFSGLCHATIAIALDIYSHAIPAIQEDAAERVAALIGGTDNDH